MLTGKWTYRSYRNDPALVGGDSQKALALIFGDGVFYLEIASGDALEGTFDMGGDYVLDLSGTALPGPDGQTTVRLSGIGRAGTPTDGWDYEYVGATAHAWPEAVRQIPSIVGRVMRATPHGGHARGRDHVVRRRVPVAANMRGLWDVFRPQRCVEAGCRLER